MAEAPAADPVPAVEAALDGLMPEGPCGVAVSGGGDSMALLAIAASWARARGREIHAVTVDHELRPGSAGEAAFVSAYCESVRVPHQTLRAGPIPRGNLLAVARELRYGLIAGWARERNARAVLLGHTMDDQAETLLMRLARGSGAEGLSGMAVRRTWLGITWLRPMLGIRRAALRDWLGGRGIAWIDDPTNQDPAFDRIKARRALAVLEPLGMTVEGLAETAARLARQRRVLLRAAAETAAVSLRFGAFGEARLGLAPLRETERDTALRVFAEALVRVGGRTYRPRFRSVEPALGRLLDQGEGTGMTLGGCMVIPDLENNSVLVCREPAAVAKPRPLRRPGVVWDGRWRVALPPEAPDGLHVGALGSTGCDRLGREARAGDWTPPEAWAATPRPVRETLPAVFGSATCLSEDLLAVPPAGYLARNAPNATAGVRADLAQPLDAAP